MKEEAGAEGTAHILAELKFGKRETKLYSKLDEVGFDFGKPAALEYIQRDKMHPHGEYKIRAHGSV